MTTEQIEFLKQFDSPTLVGMACIHAFNQRKHFAAPAWLIDAFNAGHLVRGLDARGYVDELPVIDSASIYAREFFLTDKGRELLGLPVTKVVVVAKSRTLFD